MRTVSAKPRPAKKAAPPNLSKFDFHGDALDVVKRDGVLYVGVRRVCEALGLAHQPQFVKLQKKAWATITMIVTVAEDGREREQAFVDLDSLPMWMATIEASKVTAKVRPKLLAYQREAARVLRDRFFGPKQLRPIDPRVDAVLANPERSHPRAEVRDVPEIARRIGGLILAAARTLGVHWMRVHGEILREYQVRSYRRLPLYLVSYIEAKLDRYAHGMMGMAPRLVRAARPMFGSVVQLRLFQEAS